MVHVGGRDDFNIFSHGTQAVLSGLLSTGVKKALMVEEPDMNWIRYPAMVLTLGYPIKPWGTMGPRGMAIQTGVPKIRNDVLELITKRQSTGFSVL